MTVSFELPDDIEQQLRGQGCDLGQAAKEALLVEAYRAGRLSLGQFADAMGLSTYDADGFLKQHNALLDITEEELERERSVLQELLKR
jgi:hypothetical protein